MSKEYTLKGKVKEVLGVETVGNKGTKKNTVVFSVEDGQYTDDIAVDFLNDKADQAGKLTVGDTVEVSFNVRSNQASGGRWFTNINGWKFNKVGSGY